jgi:hypothetical protein
MLSYQTLLESAIGYGIRKAILFEQQQSQALLDRDLEKAKNVELTKRVSCFGFLWIPEQVIVNFFLSTEELGLEIDLRLASLKFWRIIWVR